MRKVFGKIVHRIDPAVTPRWIAAPGLIGLRQIGGLVGIAMDVLQ